MGIALPASAAEVRLPPDALDFFEKRIRPVLVEECYECHAGEKHKGGLALDSRDGLLSGGDTGPAVIPGEPEKSLLIRSITHVDADLMMPKKAPKLDDRVITDMIAWVKMGAPDPRARADTTRSSTTRTSEGSAASKEQWWCFQPIKDPAPPVPQNAGWSEHSIDRFLLRKMEESGIVPAADADPRVLIRRLTFVLTGLPPSVEAADEFVREARVNRRAAVAAAAEHLLASRSFGEHWARHWMDLVRYAETYGSEHDYLNPYAWRYRDYLIRAFNSDLPYDRFVQEQIAGDLLEPRWNPALGINEALLGTAWQRMIESYATPVDVKREEVSVIDWQIEALGKTFLGLTIQCARCHDHKFDPISSKDFYALYGVFASTRPALSILDNPAKLTACDPDLKRLKENLRLALAVRWQRDVQPAALDAALRQSAKDALAPLRQLGKTPNFGNAWNDLRDKDARPPQEDPNNNIVFADFTRGRLDGWRVAGPGLPATAVPAGLLSLRCGDGIVRAIQPAGYFSDAISECHGGSLRSPEFVIEKRFVSVLANGAAKARLRLVIENFQNDLLLFSGVNPDLDSATPRWVTMPVKEQWLGRRARIELLTRDDKTCVGDVQDQEAWMKSDGRSSFGIQRVVLHDGAAPPAPSPFPSVLWQGEPKSWPDFVARFSEVSRAALARWAGDQATDEDTRLLQALLEGGVLGNKVGADDKSDALIAQFRDLEATIPQPTRAPGVCDDGYAYDAPLFPRGDHLHPGPPVPRHFPAVLGGVPLAANDSGRAALARELTHRTNPLAARVIVNRIWQYLTGRGLVATPDNFGKMGEKPTHPELLDHLATKFMDDGWSVKKLIEDIVTSRAWQLTAEPGAQALEYDADNHLLSHSRVRRVEAEAIRDAMLAVAGNLASGHNGPGIPVWYRTRIDPDKQPARGPIDGAGRRSVYLEARRLFPSEFLAVFDAPKPNIFTGRRSETNVPAQSLTLLNDPFVRHQSSLWGKRIATLEATDEQRIERMYLEALARPPTTEELSRALAFLNDQRENEPWPALAHAIFNMKEFIYLR